MFRLLRITQTFADPVRPSRGLTPKKPLKTKEHKNDVLRVDAAYLADQLTLYEYYLYCKITPRECLAYVNTQSGPEVQELVNFCSTYDKLGGWVKMTILNQESSIAKRANTIDHWIKVAEVSIVSDHSSFTPQSNLLISAMPCQLQLLVNELNHQRPI